MLRNVRLFDSVAGYGLITILLHWLSALGIIFLFALGIYMVDLGYYDEWYHKGPALHISIGLILFFLFSGRLIWRLKNVTPVTLTNNKSANIAATLLKILLYVCTFAVLVSGYLITTAEGQPAMVFNWLAIPASVELQAQGVDLAGELHELLAWVIIITAALHGGAALLHHFFLRDKTLVRMLNPLKK